MWPTILGLIVKWGKNPLVIVSVLAIIIISGLFIKIQFMDIKLYRMEANLVLTQAQLEQAQANFNTCKTNEQTLRDAIEEQKESINNMEVATLALQAQIRMEQQISSKWEERYKNRPVITQVREVPVIQYIDKGIVIDENSSKDYINYLNSLFD